MKPADHDRIRAYVDGELSAEEVSALLRDASTDSALRSELDAQRSLHSLLRRLPPPQFAQAEAATRKLSSRAAWRLAEFRLSFPIAIAAGLSLFMLGALLGRLSHSASRQAVVAVSSDSNDERVPVRFVFVGQAHEVAVAGTFNRWSTEGVPLNSMGDGLWEVTLPLTRGEHRYQFRIDGRWEPDPLAERQVPDGMGHLDSVLDLQ
jgi:hypothetical protein